MISNKTYEKRLAEEREFWQGVVNSLLDRIATFQPEGTKEEPQKKAALVLAPPRVANVHVGANQTILPEDQEPYISDFEMDDDAWAEYVEATRKAAPTLDETQSYPAPVTER